MTDQAYQQAVEIMADLNEAVGLLRAVNDNWFPAGRLARARVDEFLARFDPLQPENKS